MLRKNFIKRAAIISGSFIIAKDLFAKPKGPTYGHNKMLYRMDKKWGELNPSVNPVKDCHEMVQDSKGRILLLTNETKNNVLVYNKSGKLLESWGHDFPGAHGLTIHRANGEDFLFITDTVKHEVYKTTIKGQVLQTINYPQETGKYPK